MTDNQKQMLIAIANGARSTNGISKVTGISRSTIGNYFCKRWAYLLPPGLIQWQRGKCGTIQRGPLLATIMHKGEIVDVGRVEVIE